MKVIMNIVGARPQFIKASMVSRALMELEINQILIHTGQHYDFNMSDVFFKELNIQEPDYYLEIGSGTHGEQTGKMLIEIEKVLIKTKPELVIVYGDTNTTLAGALAASKLKIPLAHVEAGLRSFNKNMPEEINRLLTDHISDILFAPTTTAIDNLNKESIFENVYNVGDVMFDVSNEFSNNINISTENNILKKYELEKARFILTTIHRVDNTDNQKNLVNIFDALNYIADEGIKIFFPVHPRTRKYLKKYCLLDDHISDNLILSEPVSYGEMVVLESNAKVVITDSGGVQKESYFLKTPAVIPRSETEWVEIVEAGWNILTDANKEKIIDAALKLFNNEFHKEWKSFYGNGDASYKIAEIIKDCKFIRDCV